MSKLAKGGLTLVTAVGLTLSVGVSTAAADSRSLGTITCPNSDMSTYSRVQESAASFTVTHAVRGYSGWWYQSWQGGGFTETTQEKNWGWIKLLEGNVTTSASKKIRAASTGCGL